MLKYSLLDPVCYVALYVATSQHCDTVAVFAVEIITSWSASHIMLIIILFMPL